MKETSCSRWNRYLFWEWICLPYLPSFLCNGKHIIIKTLILKYAISYSIASEQVRHFLAKRISHHSSTAGHQRQNNVFRTHLWYQLGEKTIRV